MHRYMLTWRGVTNPVWSAASGQAGMQFQAVAFERNRGHPLFPETDVTAVR